ncbi:unnamed protein product [Linum trigynum]|uniref:Uncharacterized protein n=1 Tax=Linum trigynum TaxID=586398 RepID=A0AAV2EAG5_9ROSI
MSHEGRIGSSGLPILASICRESPTARVGRILIWLSWFNLGSPIIGSTAFGSTNIGRPVRCCLISAACPTSLEQLRLPKFPPRPAPIFDKPIKLSSSSLGSVPSQPSPLGCGLCPNSSPDP